MIKNRGITAIILLCFASMPLWGGTGSPRDGFLSFILVLAFLLILLGLLQLVPYVKRRIHDFLDNIL
ncbi:MAG: hypothetical protein U9R49_10760 [Bacteroidota bacterium]|nr:hypothetical protein [Bacteroidota bacterium]